MVSNAVKELQARKTAIAAEIAKLQKEDRAIDSAIAALSSLTTNGTVASNTGGKRQMSAAGRARIAAAAKARWAKVRAAKGTAAQPRKTGKRKMSELGRLKIRLGVFKREQNLSSPEAKALQAKVNELESQKKR